MSGARQSGGRGSATAGAAAPGVPAPGVPAGATPGGVPPGSAPPRRDVAGYVMVSVSYLLMGAIGALVNYTSAPEGVVLVLRMALAAVALAAVFGRRSMWRQWRLPGAAPRLVLMAATSSATLLLFFFALRSTGVAVAMFLLFLMPVWVALLAPRLLRTPPEPAAAPALALAVGGLVLILVPELAGGSLRVSVWGLAAGLASGFGYTAYALLVKDLTRRVAASTIALAETGLDVLFVLPLALWQLSVTGYRLTPSDLVVLLVLGLVCTSLAYMLWTEGTRRVRVEHVSVLGYLEPVSAPLYALLLLGERPGGWTLAGGALIIVAGLIVVRYGSAEAEPI